MNFPKTRVPAALAAFLLLASIPVSADDAPAKDAAAAQGELWEATSQMSMEGMPMALPANTRKVCSPKDWKEPPVANDPRQKCQTSDFRSEGSKVTWKVSCTGQMEMTGDGEITREGADKYSGRLRLVSPQATMLVKLSGQKIGPCELPR